MSIKRRKPFWNKKWGKNNICPISQGRLRPGINEEGISYVIEIPCGHRFYRKPLVAWYMKSCYESRCPVCRYKIKSEDID